MPRSPSCPSRPSRPSCPSIRSLLDSLLSTLLAPPCIACHEVLDHPLASAVCEACWTGIARLTPPLCRVCSDALPSWRAAAADGDLCARCRRIPDRVVSRLCAVGPYEGVLRAAVHALKYDGRRSLARPLGGLMREGAAGVMEGADAVVPVPLHGARRRRRGFNQAALLACELGLPVWPLLRRVRDTAPQAALPRARRHGNVRGAFAAARPLTLQLGALAGRHPRGLSPAGRVLVLVDDVTTTGATLEACGRVLKDSGATEVRALTVARAVSRLPA